MLAGLLLAVMPIPVLAEPYIQDYMISYPETLWKGAKAPLRWKAEDWVTAAVIMGVGTGLYFLDEDIRDAVGRGKQAWIDDVSLAFKQFGEGKYIYPVTGATILAGYLAGSDKTMDTGLLSLKSLLLSGAITNTLKYATQRQRPVSNNGNSFWNGEGFVRRRDAFPSGHATVVWSLAPILAQQYRDHAWVAPTVYTVATLTSLSRVYDDRHWASDIFAGAMIGYLTARLTLATTPRLEVFPDPIRAGIQMSVQF